MKTRSAEMEAPNIAAIVKARHHARVLCPSSGHLVGNTPNQLISPGIYESAESGCSVNNFYSASGTSGQTLCDDVKISVDDKPHKTRSENAPRLLRGTWSPDDRRLFFQAVRMYGRNFSEITRFIRSRGHRTSIDHQTGSSSGNIELTLNSLHSGNNFVSSNSLSSALIPSNISAPCPSNITQPSVGMSTPCTGSSDLNTPCGGRTREQVRFFYQQTWHKVRRYTKFPEEVPQHVREVYAIVNYSVLRTRIKKPLDHRLGEKLNELVHCGTTVIKHNGRRFLLRTPVCPALKQLNNISEKQDAVHEDPVESPDLVTSNSTPNLTSSSLRTSDLRNSESINGLSVTTSTSNAELDLRDLGKQLSIGVTREMAREIKLVTIYLSLGCPDRIRFEYQFFCTKDKGLQKQLNSSYSDLVICPPLDPDGDGISNGLRRLLHLNASDYLLHRDWVSRHPIRSNTPVPASCHSSQAIPSVNISTVTTVAATQSCTSTLLPKTLTGSHLSQISELPIMVTAQLPSTVTTSISAKQPTVMMYSQPNTIQVLINGQPSIFQLNSTFSASNPIISSLLTTNSLMKPPIASVQSPKLVLLQQPVGQKIQVPIVERQLDHERQVTSTVAMSQGPYIPLLPKQSTVPIQVSVKTSTPLTGTFVSSSSIPSTSTYMIENENNSPVTSSLESLKAFNARRRTSIISQVNKRLTENSILTKELQSKPSTITSISNNLPPSYNTSANPCTTKSSVQSLQAIDNQTLTTIKGDEASVNNIHSKSITLSTPSNSNNLWSSINVSNNEPMVTTSIVFNDQLPQVHSISSLLSSPNLSSLQSNNVMSFISLSKNSSNTDVNMDDLLLVSTETNQCSMSSSSFSNDTLASLLNTLCPRCPLSSTHDNQNILTESSARPTDSTLSPLNELSTPDLHKTTFSTPTTNDVNVSLKIEENAEKSLDFRTIDSVCSYPPVSPSIGDISFTDSMAAAVMDVHHMELDHSDGEQSTDVHSEPLNLIASNLNIQPDIYPIRPSYESLVEHDDIKTRGISRSEYNCITNVEVFLRMNTPQSRRNSVGLNSTLQIPTTSSS
ncbi:unnamed protein product [Schistosoma intercalatum]|nr:unnamed protein product [Schistosoma intercalatum]